MFGLPTYPLPRGWVKVYANVEAEDYVANLAIAKREAAAQRQEARRERKKSKRKKTSFPAKNCVVVAHAFAQTEEFLKSWEWRTLRMKVLKKYGARCQCCGATAADGVRICVDHIKPRKTHPHLALVEDNLQVLCDPCNQGKGAWDDTDWRGYHGQRAKNRSQPHDC